MYSKNLQNEVLENTAVHAAVHFLGWTIHIRSSSVSIGGDRSFKSVEVMGMSAKMAMTIEQSWRWQQR